MTAGDARIRQPKFVVFPDVDPHDERLAAVVVVRDHQSGSIKAITKDVPGRPQPDPEIVAALVTAVEIANL